MLALFEVIEATHHTVPTFKGVIDLSVPDGIPAPVSLSETITRRLAEFTHIDAKQKATQALDLD